MRRRRPRSPRPEDVARRLKGEPSTEPEWDGFDPSNRPPEDKINPLRCFKCERELWQAGYVYPDGHKPNQPVGTAFDTAGHYGSSVFDPMRDVRLEIALCDPCLRAGWHNTRQIAPPPRTHWTVVVGPNLSYEESELHERGEPPPPPITWANAPTAEPQADGHPDA
jgi:hypothetical protein